MTNEVDHIAALAAEQKKEKPKARSPDTVVRELMAASQYLTDHSDTVYLHNGRFYEELSRARLRQIACFADGARKSTETRRREIVDHLKALSHREFRWGRVADSEVALENGVLNVLTDELRPHRPDDYLERVIPWPWAPGAQCPGWLAALATWFPVDAGEQAALQEFFGYALLSHAKYKKALLIYGESDTGKSVPARVLMQAVGEVNACSLPVDQMDDPTARAVIVGKQLNHMTELSVDAMIADGGFKQMVSTEEPLLINQKYKPAYMYLPTAKHLFVTNTLPRMNDRTEAILNRLLIVPMRRVLTKAEQDEALPAKLLTEMPGIVLWAIEGAKRLVERGGRFTEPAGAAVLLGELREEANPVIDFLRERLKCDDSSAIPLSRLADVFNAWHRGARKASTKALGKMLRDAGHVIRPIRYGARTNARGAAADSGIHKSLVGFRVIAEHVPRHLDVPQGSVIGPAGLIDSSTPLDGSEDL